MRKLSYRRPGKFLAIIAVSALCVGPSIALAPGPVSASTMPTLGQAFDNVGTTTPANPGPGNFDGIGDSFSATGLAGDGLLPGARLLHDGLQLTWPDVAAGAPDNVLADGQTVALTGTGSTLGIVGASAYGFRQWHVHRQLRGRYLDQCTGNAFRLGRRAARLWYQLPGHDGRLGPGGSIPVSLSYATVPLDPSEQVTSVTLPTITSTVGSGVNSMHVFYLVVGTPGAQASGAPGAASYYDQARKDCVGTAADTASRVWYTVADGTLSDTYAPTIDNTDVKSLEPVATGPGFTALQPRDMTYTVSELGTTGMACRVVALDASEHFAIVSDFITNPASEAVVMQESLVALPGAPAGLHVYLRFNPLLNGHGGGGTDNAGAESATIVHTRRGLSRCLIPPTPSPRPRTAATPPPSTPPWPRTNPSAPSRRALWAPPVTV